jgi:hypothetical protein
MAMKRHLPPARVVQFMPLAMATKKGNVVVACRDNSVAAQYRKGVVAAGGVPENLVFVFIGEATAEMLPQSIICIDPKRAHGL